ncbi:UDP-4-amino-4,6-dideoxy-N-acetyl-beta-L-altrosamine transaminase [Azospirillum fermentarium]|uniref:UDP-4-amino-4, 6-dideoxy-N-acetyl-beta-L-altrosamine transaminase n=1 Tax=Azospirillum fermentarium TaxID=1233114 RepID=UPI002227BA7B|nr:UDP-4-amino-4,6-dideoxy-N-acetyl-beta-L-altrosamine transaminase [Azospirillum fermentarium]MCW2249514.1 UDP-4-amino-4,6-dideoxy-N-acetyl-beta-L-altrosamine transaminase [Azospirillum fermentarium]
MSRRLPYGRQSIDESDIAAVTAVLRGDWLTGGPAVASFETAFAGITGAAHAVACCNGTAALHLSALALGLGPGDHVVVPSLTFLATANAARYVGAEVVFADCDPETGLMRPQDLEAALATSPGPVKAVYPVHLNGQTADMAGIAAIATARELAVVEDACHAVGGVTATGDVVGNCQHSTMAVFSLHPVKTITMGEGGVVTTNDPVLARRVARLRNHGMTRDPADFTMADQAWDPAGAANPWYYEMPEPGFNYRACDLQCALGLSQLQRIDRFIARRRELVTLYDRLLAPLAPVIRPAGRTGGRPGWHLYAILMDFPALGTDRATLMRRLDAEGIGTQVHYLPVHRQSYYRQRYGMANLPGADRYYARCLSLPLFPDMADEDAERVAHALTRIVRG